MTYLEHYLCDYGDQAVISTIKDGAEEGKIFWPESGDTYKWVSIFRAADLHFTTQDSSSATFSLFRMREEGLTGGSPQIIVRCVDRYARMENFGFLVFG
jgi:hypothetical protein